jgi:cardiolipin synthase
VAFVGGMNIGVEYGSSIHHHADAWRDTVVRLEGTVAQDLAVVFADGWARANATWPIDEDVPLHTATSVVPTPSVDDARALVLDARPGRGQRAVLTTLALLVGGARHRVWITTPYFAPPVRALWLLADAVRRGVDVRLLLPGPRTDVPLVRHAAHGTYASLLANGVQLYEYQRATLHAKTLVVDGTVSVIGSTNLDFRSFWWNAECNVLLHDTATAAVLEAHFLDDLSTAAAIRLPDWRQRGWWHRTVDACAWALRWGL